MYRQFLHFLKMKKTIMYLHIINIVYYFTNISRHVFIQLSQSEFRMWSHWLWLNDFWSNALLIFLQYFEPSKVMVVMFTWSEKWSYFKWKMEENITIELDSLFLFCSCNNYCPHNNEHSQSSTLNAGLTFICKPHLNFAQHSLPTIVRM